MMVKNRRVLSIRVRRTLASPRFVETRLHEEKLICIYIIPIHNVWLFIQDISIVPNLSTLDIMSFGTTWISTNILFTRLGDTLNTGDSTQK